LVVPGVEMPLDPLRTVALRPGALGVPRLPAAPRQLRRRGLAGGRDPRPLIRDRDRGSEQLHLVDRELAGRERVADLRELAGGLTGRQQRLGVVGAVAEGAAHPVHAVAPPVAAPSVELVEERQVARLLRGQRLDEHIPLMDSLLERMHIDVGLAGYHTQKYKRTSVRMSTPNPNPHKGNEPKTATRRAPPHSAKPN